LKKKRRDWGSAISAPFERMTRTGSLEVFPKKPPRKREGPDNVCRQTIR